MSFKVLIGILLLIFGLGTGVVEWVTKGFTGPYPFVGLALSAVGLYLMASGLRRKRASIVGGKEVITAAGVIAGVAAGTLLVETLRKRQSKLSDREILELEKMLEEARLTGKITPQKYVELKAELENIKRRRGLK